MAVAFPQIRVGELLRYQALSVFPLFTQVKSTVEYALADEALRDQLLTVQEVSEGGSVPELLVENKGTCACSSSRGKNWSERSRTGS